MPSFENISETHKVRSGASNAAKIPALIAELNSQDGLVRHRARAALVEIGEPAVDSLIKILKSRDGHICWETAKVLGLIGSPKVIQTFIELLEDNEFSLRWLAAEGLITVGRPGVVPLLETLAQHSDSVWLREGAHHVLHDLITRRLADKSVREQLEPVLAALSDIEPAITVHVAAWKALSGLKK